jgi:hypothetical protein
MSSSIQGAKSSSNADLSTGENMMIKEKLICKQCGQETVAKDAFAVWDFETQQYMLHSTYDNEKCLNEDCEADESGQWINVDVSWKIEWGPSTLSNEGWIQGDECHETKDSAEHAANLLRAANHGNPKKLYVRVIEVVSHPPGSSETYDAEVNKDTSQQEKPS